MEDNENSGSPPSPNKDKKLQENIEIRCREKCDVRMGLLDVVEYINDRVEFFQTSCPTVRGNN